MEGEKQTLQAEITQLHEKIQVSTADLNAQIVSLRGEKEAAEKALENQKASKSLDPADQDSVIVSSMFPLHHPAPNDPCL